MKLFLPDEQATKNLGAAFGRYAVNRTLIALSGQLGTGKTVFVKGLAESLGIKEMLTSPTFVLMNEYPDALLPLYHIDLYRMQETIPATATTPRSNAAQEMQSVYDCTGSALNALDFLKAELEELTRTASVVVIEWAEFLDQPHPGQDKAKHFLSEYDHLTLALAYVDDNDAARMAEILSFGQNSDELLQKVTTGFVGMII